MKNKYKILLLGGAKRVTLAEQIIQLTKDFLELEFFSIEKDEGFYPISSIAKIIKGPIFGTEEFENFILEKLQGGDVIPISCMDNAVISMAKFSGDRYGDVTIVAPLLEGARIALNKKKTAIFCEQNNIAHPKIIYNKNYWEGKIIAKPIEGFGSKKIYILDNDCFEKYYDRLKESHIFQAFVEGRETTHDIYIDKNQNIFISSRDRLAVSDGEVDHCIVRDPNDDEVEICSKIAKSGLFWGAMNIQTIRAPIGIFLIEINARLGGGVTASIAAGFPIIELFLKESIGIDLPKRKKVKLEMKRARRDFYKII
jgi:carbamoyl-phosphate synthase large subunit